MTGAADHGTSVTRLRHHRIELALHRLREADGPALLLVHELGGRTPDAVPADVEAWPGRIFALDLTGHGASSWPRGGGYSPEVLMGDLDVALAEIGPATLVGRGVGAFLALLVAGGRPREVRGTILLPGRGLEGGGPEPLSIARSVLPEPSPGDGLTDPFALLELDNDVRPPGYARVSARQACHLAPVTPAITVAIPEPRPPWVEALLELDGVVSESLDAALARYARTPEDDATT